MRRMKLVLKCENYSLDNSLSPSFLSSIYESPKPNTWVKIAGYLGGKLKIEQEKEKLIITTTAETARKNLEQLAILETGLWHEEFEKRIKLLPPRFRDIAEALSERYSGIRIPIAPRDFDYILLAVLLSKRANYDIVRMWCRRIWRFSRDSPLRIISIKPSQLRRITRSYQLQDAVKSIKSLMRLISEPERLPREIIKCFGNPKKPLSSYVLSLPPEVARLVLLSAWGIGAKVADSVILSTFKASNFMPCDVHLKIFIERLALVNEFKMPEKNFCKSFLCNSEGAWGLNPCPNSRCLRFILRPLGELAGWIQTMIYLHGRDYCKPIKPRCHKCPVKSLCISSKVSG